MGSQRRQQWWTSWEEVDSRMLRTLLLTGLSTLAFCSGEGVAPTTYTEWTPCSVCCTQFRDLIVPPTVPDIDINTDFVYSDREYRPCTGGACPEHCAVSLWSAWTPCTLSHRWRNRTRYFVHPSDALQLACGYVRTIEVHYCREDQLTRFQCSVQYQWSTWDGTCNCDSTVFQYQRRTRECAAPLHLPEEVQVRPCLSANNPMRLLHTACNRPLSYQCFPSTPIIAWSPWQCDAQCIAGTLNATGVASRHRAVGVRQARNMSAQLELAVCNCPMRFQLAECTVACTPSTATSPAPDDRGPNLPPFGATSPHSTFASHRTTAPSFTVGPFTSGDRGYPLSVTEHSVPQLLIGVCSIMAALVTGLAFSSLTFYRRYKRSEELLKALRALSAGCDGQNIELSASCTTTPASRNSADSSISSPIQQSNTIDIGRPDGTNNKKIFNLKEEEEEGVGGGEEAPIPSEGGIGADIFVNPYYGSSLQYPHYRDAYAESSTSSAGDTSTQLANGRSHNAETQEGALALDRALPNNFPYQPDFQCRNGQLVQTSSSSSRQHRRRLIDHQYHNPTHGSSVSAVYASSTRVQRLARGSGGARPGSDGDGRGATSVSWASSTDESTSAPWIHGFARPRRRRFKLNAADSRHVPTTTADQTPGNIPENDERQESINHRSRSWS